MRNHPSSGRIRSSPCVKSVAVVLLLASVFGIKTAPNMPLPDIPANPPAPPAKILYLFPKGEGDGIPTGKENDIADQMSRLVSDRLAVKRTDKGLRDPADCPAASACESVQVYAEKTGKTIVVELKFYALRGIQSHEVVPSEAKDCTVEPGTSDKDCLMTDLDLLVPELISHYRIYHDQTHHGGDR